jgi:hypothetical protein
MFMMEVFQHVFSGWIFFLWISLHVPAKSYSSPDIVKVLKQGGSMDPVFTSHVERKFRHSFRGLGMDKKLILKWISLV